MSWVARQRADRRQLGRALLDLPVELRQVRMRRIGRQRRGKPVHADVVAREIVEHAAQRLERVAQVRAGLPAPRVVAGQPALTQDLDREAQPHALVYGSAERPDQVRRSESSAGSSGLDLLAAERIRRVVDRLVDLGLLGRQAVVLVALGGIAQLVLGLLLALGLAFAGLGQRRLGVGGGLARGPGVVGDRGRRCSPPRPRRRLPPPPRRSWASRRRAARGRRSRCSPPDRRRRSWRRAAACSSPRASPARRCGRAAGRRPCRA